MEKYDIYQKLQGKQKLTKPAFFWAISHTKLTISQCWWHSKIRIFFLASWHICLTPFLRIRQSFKYNLSKCKCAKSNANSYCKCPSLTMLLWSWRFIFRFCVTKDNHSKISGSVKQRGCQSFLTRLLRDISSFSKCYPKSARTFPIGNGNLPQDCEPQGESGRWFFIS